MLTARGNNPANDGRSVGAATYKNRAIGSMNANPEIAIDQAGS
jgi:hypothetical protein